MFPTDTIRKLLATPPDTLAAARRVLDAIKGTLPAAKPSKPAIPANRDGTLTPERIDAIMTERERTGDDFASIVSRVIGGISAEATPSPASVKSTAAQPATPAQLAKIAALEKTLAARDATLASLKAREAELLATKAKATQKEHDMRRRAASFAAAKATASSAPAEPTLAYVMRKEPLGTLRNIVSGKYAFSVAEKSAAASELQSRGWVSNSDGTIWARSVDCGAAKREARAQRQANAARFVANRNR